MKELFPNHPLIGISFGKKSDLPLFRYLRKENFSTIRLWFVILSWRMPWKPEIAYRRGWQDCHDKEIAALANEKATVELKLSETERKLEKLTRELNLRNSQKDSSVSDYYRSMI
jgi:hypothetical protein